MREPLTVEVLGLQAVPHDFNMKISRDGRSCIPDPNQRLKLWQSTVRNAAMAAWGDAEPYCGDVEIRAEFIAKTPYGRSHGDRWSREISWDAKGGKSRSRDSAQPDGDNLLKALLDSVKGVIIADDVTVTDASFTKRYGPAPGVRFTVTPLD